MSNPIRSRFITGKKLLAVLVAIISLQAMAQNDAEYLNVLAVNGLNMRSRPDADARIVTRVAFGKRVEVAERTKVELQLGWIRDNWFRVRYRGREGFIFGGYLSGLPAPEAATGNVSSGRQATTLPELLLGYAKEAFTPEGKAVRSLEPDASGDTLNHTLLRFVGGIELEMEQRADHASVLLLLPYDVEKTYVLLEALLKQNGRSELLERLRFVKGKDGRLSRVSSADGAVRISRLSGERAGLRVAGRGTGDGGRG